MTPVWFAPWSIDQRLGHEVAARDASTGAALDLNRRATLGRSSEGAFDDFRAV